MSTNLRIEMTRVFKAPRRKVFEAWTKPGMINRWMLPHDEIVPDASVDLREGGTYRIGMKGNIGDRVIDGYATGTYKEVVRDERLSFTWTWHFEDTGVVAEETLVTVTLRDVDGGTEMTLVHEKFGTTTNRDDYFHGWEHCFQVLERTLSA